MQGKSRKIKNKVLLKIDQILNGEGYWSAFLRMLPVVLMAGLVSLIVREVHYQTQLSGYPWFALAEDGYEFFLAPKSVVLTILFLLMVTIIAIRYKKTGVKLHKVKLFLPLMVYLLFVVLSSVFSVNRSFSFGGSYEQFEPVWVLLCYGTAVFYLYLFAVTLKEKQVVADAICANATIVGFIGVLQGLGFDPFHSLFVQKIIASKEYLAACGGKMTIGFDNNTAYSTLYNPNYLGVFGSFLVPFLATLLLLEKNLWRRLWHLLGLVLVIGAMLFSGSRAGLISVGVSALVLLIICFRSVMKWWFLSIPVVNLAVAILLLVNNYTDNSIFMRMKSAFQPEEIVVNEELAPDGTLIKKTGLTELYTTKEGVVICYNEKRAIISMYVDGNAYGFYAFDENDKELTLNANETGTVFTFSEPALAELSIEPVYIAKALGFYLNAGKQYSFWSNGTEYVGFNALGRETSMIKAESAVFHKNLNMFSGRLFIWSRSIPLLKKHIFLGSGPDTFLLEFPQKDYLNMTKYGYENMVMTKPHSLYLQVGVQTGVISLISLLVFFIWYSVQSLRLYCFKKLQTQVDAIGVAAFIGTIGYMITAISNDSMVVTAPVFWVMIGLGIAANAEKKKAKEKEAKAGILSET